jgi:hypothetical protein
MPRISKNPKFPFKCPICKHVMEEHALTKYCEHVLLVDFPFSSFLKKDPRIEPAYAKYLELWEKENERVDKTHDYFIAPNYEEVKEEIEKCVGGKVSCHDVKGHAVGRYTSIVIGPYPEEKAK